MEKIDVQIPISENGTGLKIGIVIGQFNKEVSDRMRLACGEQLVNLGVSTDHIAYVEAPGALEIPMLLSAMARSGNFDALIALGSVIRGDTYHFEIVSNESANGIMSVQLNSGIPIANGILTCENMTQIEERIDGKSKDCAKVAIKMARLLSVFNEG